ncbi:MAG: hypothetical protein NC131_13870 [Roseburia sp.]|nr:hypothetical protein [Roseburia sp.]
MRRQLKDKKDCNCYDVGEDKIEYIRARELLVSNRIDLVVKYKYVEAYDKGMNIPFIRDLYYAHLEAFSGGTFIEPGKENTKRSYQDYIDTFNTLIESIKKNGIKKELSVIPVGRNNTIINGSHRVAIAMYYDLTVPIVRYEELDADYDYNFFAKGLLDKKYLDYMATEYIRLKKDVFFACIWSKADKSKNAVIDKMIRECCDVVYTSSIFLNYQGLRNLMIQIYGHQKWCGNIQNGYKGVLGKVDACYQDNSETIIYVLDNVSLEKVVNLKNRIRSIYQIQNSSIHISDNSQESLEIAHILLNQNSVDLLNYGDICKCKEYISWIQQLGRELDLLDINREDFLVDSSGVLGIYGIRKPSDIDYLTFEKINNQQFSVNMEEHDKNMKYYLKPKEELIYNPNNYLFAYGVKFSTLPVLYEMKRKRNEKKDIEDCSLIKPYIEKQITCKTKLNQCKIIFKRKCRNIIRKIKIRIVILLRKINLYNFAKKIYTAIKVR